VDFKKGGHLNFEFAAHKYLTKYLLMGGRVQILVAERFVTGRFVTARLDTDGPTHGRFDILNFGFPIVSTHLFFKRALDRLRRVSTLVPPFMSFVNFLFFPHFWYFLSFFSRS